MTQPLRYRRRPICNESGYVLDEETGHVTMCLCTLPADHRLDQHHDRRRGHWWPRVETPTLPPPRADEPTVDGTLF